MPSQPHYQIAALLLQQALRRHQRPVSLAEVKAEVLPGLHLPVNFRSPLSQAIRGLIHHSTSDWEIYAHPVAPPLYYAKRSWRQRRYLQYYQLWQNWRFLALSEEASALSTATLPLLRYGRRLQLWAWIETLLSPLDQLLEQSHKLPQVVTGPGRLLRQEMQTLREAVSAALSYDADHQAHWPTRVSLTVEGWTPEELRQQLQHLYPSFATYVTSPSIISEHLNGRIRRIYAPLYPIRSTMALPRNVTRYYDATDARLWAATQWGGATCRSLARRAQQELGRLRDANFVFPALSAPDPGHRLTALAALAFLQPPTAAPACAALARADPEIRVRHTALWATAFLLGTEAALERLPQVPADPAPVIQLLVSELRQASNVWQV